MPRNFGTLGSLGWVFLVPGHLRTQSAPLSQSQNLVALGQTVPYGAWRYVGVSKILRTLGSLLWDVADPWKYVPSHICYLAKCVGSGSDRMSVISEIFQKIDHSRSTFQGHSRSFEPTCIDRLPMTSY